MDSAGSAYVTGTTLSTETMGFPVTVGPKLTHSGYYDAFVAKVNSAVPAATSTAGRCRNRRRSSNTLTPCSRSRD